MQQKRGQMVAHNVSGLLCKSMAKAKNVHSVWSCTRAATEVGLLLIMYLLLLMQLRLLLVRVLAGCGVQVLRRHSFLCVTATHCVLPLSHLTKLGLLLTTTHASQVIDEGASH